MPLLTCSTTSHTLHLSTFTLDDFEHALRHSVADPSCSLLAEIHSSLIYNLRTVPFIRHSAVLSLLHQKDNQKVPVDSDDEDSNDGLDASADDLAAAMADIGNSWERVPLRHVEGREGWQDALVGCLKDVGCHRTFAQFFAQLPSCYSTPTSINSRVCARSLLVLSLLRRRKPRKLHPQRNRLIQDTLRLFSTSHQHRPSDTILYHRKTRLTSCPSFATSQYQAKPSTHIWRRAKSNSRPCARRK